LWSQHSLFRLTGENSVTKEQMQLFVFNCLQLFGYWNNVLSF
jgi:hypothetical protein